MCTTYRLLAVAPESGLVIRDLPDERRMTFHVACPIKTYIRGTRQGYRPTYLGQPHRSYGDMRIMYKFVPLKVKK